MVRSFFTRRNRPSEPKAEVAVDNGQEETKFGDVPPGK